MLQSTISGNISNGLGGGVFTGSGIATIRNSTIVGNKSNSTFFDSSGGGVAGAGPGTNSVVDQTIIAGNMGLESDWLVDTFYSGIPNVTYSLIGNRSGNPLSESPFPSPDANGNLIGGPIHGVINPKLGPLANNGGLTETYALLPGSPAVNAGNSAAVAGVGNTPQFDQRGVPFGRIVGGRIDIGAVEAQPNPLPGDYNFDGVVDAADYVVWRATLGSATDLRADGSGNGVIDGDDRNFWMAHFGQALAGSGSAAEFTEQEGNFARAISVGSVQTAPTIAPGSVAAREIDLLLPLVKTGPVGARLLANGLADHSALDCSRDNALLNWIESQSRSWLGPNESIRDLSSLDPTNHESADSRDVAFDDVFEKLVAII